MLACFFRNNKLTMKALNPTLNRDFMHLIDVFVKKKI